MMNRNNTTVTLSGILNGGKITPKVQKALHDMIAEDTDRRTIFAQDADGIFIPVMDVKRCDTCPPELFDKILKHIADYGKERENARR